VKRQSLEPSGFACCSPPCPGAAGLSPGPRFSPTKLADNPYMWEGAGGNLGSIGTTRCSLIDDHFARLGQDHAAVAKCSPRSRQVQSSTRTGLRPHRRQRHFGKAGTVSSRRELEELMSTDQMSEFLRTNFPASPRAASADGHLRASVNFCLN